MSNYKEFRRRSLKRRMWQRVFNMFAVLCAVAVFAGVGWYGAMQLGLLESIMPKDDDSAASSAQSNSTVPQESAQPTSEPTPAPTPVPITAQTSIAVPNSDDANWNRSDYPIRVLNAQVQPQGDGTTAMDYRLAANPQAGGTVQMSYFETTTFLGDSITQALELYVDKEWLKTNFCAYKSISPNAIVNESVLTKANGAQEVALDAMVASAPERVYILLGMNTLTANTDYSSYLQYYSVMIDMIRERLPYVDIYVQSVTPVMADVVHKKPGLFKERLWLVNDELSALALSKNCYFVNLWEVLADDEGNLKAEYNGGDGIHLNEAGSVAWIEYLRTHTVYESGVAYEAGTSYYIEQ